MSVVVDSSVLVAALIDSGPAGRWAENLISAEPLIAPALIHAETTNVLRRMALAEEISSIEANLARADLMALDIDLFPFEPFADRVWELRANVTSYDAWYVAIAEAIDIPFATLDRRLTRTRGVRCAFMTTSG